MDVIKAAYRRLALKYHPDKNLNNIQWATEKFRNLVDAYEYLREYCTS